VEKPIIIAGDFNICHHPIDIHNPVSNKKSPGFLPEEREWLGGLLNRGLADTWRHFHPEEQAFTWWTYRFNARAKNLGWRIDYVLVSPSLLPRITDCRIDSEVFLSDHVPVVLELK
jgi:exodeoxyribonuclease III